MTATTDSPQPSCSRPAGGEITPDEFDYYLRRAREMRAEHTADLIERGVARIGRLWARARAAFGRGPSRLGGDRAARAS
jgi:hypothetical protein